MIITIDLMIKPNNSLLSCPPAWYLGQVAERSIIRTNKSFKTSLNYQVMTIPMVKNDITVMSGLKIALLPRSFCDFHISETVFYNYTNIKYQFQCNIYCSSSTSKQ